MERQGRVYLVGAGPGAPDLITVRGLNCLRRADFVLYDALTPPELLAEARPDAERIYVGKRGYCVGSTVQGEINELLVQLGRAGHVVCRLKGGDPCVFGRGGEEAEALAAAGVPFEIIPGVTAAVALGTIGIPLTHREVGQSVALVTGHFAPDSPDCTLDWTALARMSGVVFYMGLRHLEAIAGHMIAAGADPQTPAAVVASLTRPGQRIIDGPLCELAELVRGADVQAPAVIVVGEVVRHRQKLMRWVNAAQSSPVATGGLEGGIA
jgi:uroporphyrin-III C-methyltransferase